MGYTMGHSEGSGDVLYACVEAREPGLVLYLDPGLKSSSRAMTPFPLPQGSSFHSIEPPLG
jgi:hypothetical protein